MKLEILPYASTRELMDHFLVGDWSVAFIPVDDVQEKSRGQLKFGSAHIVLQSTYLVRPRSRIKTLADVDKRGVRVATVGETTAARAAARSLKSASVTNVKTTDESLEYLKSGRADAVALSRESAIALSANLPGSRVLDGAFWKSYAAIAVSSTRSPVVFPYLSAFIDEAIASGRVRRALDKAGMPTSVVPQPGTRP